MEKSTPVLMRRLLQKRKKLTFVNNVLYRKILHKDGREILQMVVLENLKPVLLESVHSKAHHCSKRMRQLLQTTCYWANISMAVEEYCRKRTQYNIAKPPQFKYRGTLRGTKTFELVFLDFTELETDNKSYQFLLVVSNVFFLQNLLLLYPPKTRKL